MKYAFLMQKWTGNSSKRVIFHPPSFSRTVEGKDESKLALLCASPLKLFKSGSRQNAQFVYNSWEYLGVYTEWLQRCVRNKHGGRAEKLFFLAAFLNPNLSQCIIFPVGKKILTSGIPPSGVIWVSHSVVVVSHWLTLSHIGPEPNITHSFIPETYFCICPGCQ